MTKPLIYVASPYTKGDPAINTHFQCLIFDRLLTDQIVIPFVPLWSHFQHGVKPRPYEDWVKYDMAIIERCDGVLRLNAEIPELNYRQCESSGADAEVARCIELNKPVFFSIEECYAWVKLN
jgi:hypothetical protein